MVANGGGFFTVGIVVDKIGVLTSKSNGKPFTIIKLSDIVKYDMAKVKSHIATQHKNDEKECKTALKAYSDDGYKSVSFFAFEKAAMPAKNITPGSVIAILNPRLMSSAGTQKQGNVDDRDKQNSKAMGHSFIFDSENSIVRIGYSKDFNICSASSTNPVTL